MNTILLNIVNLDSLPLNLVGRIRKKRAIAGGLLPNGYTRLSYLESTGAEYIDTGFVPNQDTRVYAVLACPFTDSANWAFGAREGYNINSFAFVASTTGKFNSQYNVEACAVDSSFSTDGFFVLDKDKNSTYINGQLAYKAAYEEFTCPVPMTLFAGNTNGTITGGKVKIETLEIYDNGVLVRDFIACMNEEGVKGMYDLVNKTFHPSKTAAPFIGGEALPSIEEFMAADGEFEASDGKYYVEK